MTQFLLLHAPSFTTHPTAIAREPSGPLLADKLPQSVGATHRLLISAHYRHRNVTLNKKHGQAN